MGLVAPIAASAQAGATASVVLTFDDIPVGQAQPGTSCRPAELRRITERLTEVLAVRRAPSVAFVTTGNVCDSLRAPVLAEVVRTWERAGARIGNHGHGHLDLSRVPLATYLADVGRADRHIRDALGGAPALFRHPFLHAGPDTATANGLDRWLAANGYRAVPVTIDNHEWVFARAYSRARGRGDSAMMGRLVPAYLAHLDQAFAFAESLAVRVTGGSIPQVLLLHANELNADHLGAVLGVIERRGYRFVSVEDALAHPAYRRPSRYVGPRGISWILRWSPDPGVWDAELPPPPEWVR